MTKKTICFFNSNRAWGGGEKWHLTTAKEFLRRGYGTILVANLGSELEKKAGVEGVEVTSFFVHNLSFLNPFKILAVRSFFKSHRVDAVVINLPSDLKLAGIAAKLAGVKKIIYRRGMPHPLRNTWLNRFLFQKVLTHVVVNSQEIGRSLKQGNEEWFPVEKLVLVYNGVDTKKGLPLGQPLYREKDDEWVIGNAGRLTSQKGQTYLLDMAEVLRNEGVNFKVLIAGEGELRHELVQLIAKKGLQKEVRLLGHVEDMSSFLSSLDVFVFTSLYEGSANTLIETLQHGVPTVAFDCSSNPEVVVNGSTGILVPAGDIEGLAHAVLELKDDRVKREALAEQGKILVRGKFDSSRNLNVLEELIR